MSQRVAICSGRQTGKTEMSAIKGLYEAIWNDNSVILIVSPTQRQSGILFRRMKALINRSSQKVPELGLKDMITRETLTLIEFENGSVIHCLPAAEDGSNIRGFTANYIIIDEAAYINDMVYVAIKPMLITTKGRLMLIGTPFGVNNFFYKVFHDKKLGFSTHRFKSIASPLISEKDLQKERETLPLMMYKQEYEGEFIDEADQFFTLSMVERCTDNNCPVRSMAIKGLDYFLGFDPARHGQDEAVAIVIEKASSEGRVVSLEAIKHQTLMQQASYILKLHELFNFKRIMIDETGMGGGLVDMLKTEAIPVEGLTFSIKTKEEVYNNLKMMMASNRIVLPKHDKLRKQLLEMKYEFSQAGHLKIYHPAKTGHDDYPTALALAAWAMKSKHVPLLFGKSTSVLRQ
ncbi:MAG: terminase large subunit domain-containing protein [Candidatus Heimdallarchaeota archaeon]